MENYLIINIQPNDQVHLQVNKRDTDGICYNLTFNKVNDYLECDGFMVPTFSGNFNLPITGNTETRSLVHCLKTLPKVQENKTDITGFIIALIKKEKLNYFQVNVNGNMDYNNAKPIDLATIATLVADLQRLNIPLEF